jgi:hypothetical protein
VKRVAEEVLAVLKREKLVLDWRKEQRTRAAVRVSVEETLDRLPEKYTRQIYVRSATPSTTTSSSRTSTTATASTTGLRRRRSQSPVRLPRGPKPGWRCDPVVAFRADTEPGKVAQGELIASGRGS